MPDTGTEKSHAQKMLDAIEAAIDRFAEGGGQRTTSIDGVTFSYASLADLLTLRAFYQAEVRKEKGCRLYRVKLHLSC